MRRALIIFFTAISLFASPVIDVNGGSYQIYAEFSSSLSADEILSVLYYYSHVREYSSKSNLKIDLISERENYNLLRYSYDYRIAELDILMRREICRDNRSLVFRMEEYNRSNFLIPLLLSSEGRYEVVPSAESGRWVVRYHQSSTMNSRIGWIYERLILRESRDFLEEVVSYMENLSKRKDSASSVAAASTNSEKISVF